MIKKLDIFENIVMVICLIFVIAMCLFHISYDGYLGISQAKWETIWAISINGFTLFIIILIANLTVGYFSRFFSYILIPYFAVKLIYDFSVFSGVYIISPEWWERVWSWILPLLLVLLLIKYLVHHVRENLE
jgi:hypothetical protein